MRLFDRLRELRARAPEDDTWDDAGVEEIAAHATALASAWDADPDDGGVILEIRGTNADRAWYVDGDAGSDWLSGTASKPFASIERVVGYTDADTDPMVVSGDSVKMRGSGAGIVGAGISGVRYSGAF